MVDKKVNPNANAVSVAPINDSLINERRQQLVALGGVTSAVFVKLSRLINEHMQDQGFWESENFGEKIALVHSELSEALEAHRKELRSEHLSDTDGVSEELADAVIRIFDIAAQRNIDLGYILIDKMLYNLTRPFKHGKKY